MHTFYVLKPGAEKLIGYLPSFLDLADPRPAAEQFDERYAHGGGWRPMDGWSMDPHSCAIEWPGDPRLIPIAATEFRDEVICVYEHAWVAIIQPDRSYQICRMD